MLLKEIYKNLDVYANEDGTDDYYPPDDFNRIIEEEQINLVIDLMDEEKKRPYTMRPMTDFLLATDNQAASSSYYFWEMPEDYLRFRSMVYTPDSGPIEPVEFVSPEEYSKRTDDILSPPPEENRMVYIEEGPTTSTYFNAGRWFLCFPSETTGEFGMFYTRQPSTPFLDYYINANQELTFLDEGAVLNDIKTGTYRDGTPMGSVNGTATTQELEIPVEFHERYMQRLMERLGIKDRDQMVTQHAMVKDQIDGNENKIV